MGASCFKSAVTHSAPDSAVVARRAKTLATTVQPLAGKHTCRVTSVYDGDTFTVEIKSADTLVQTKIRVIGYDSEEIKCKMYSELKETAPSNELERALDDFCNNRRRREAKDRIVAHKHLILYSHDLWFRRISALAAKYALIERLKQCENRVVLDVPDLRNSFDRVLAHVTLVDTGESLCDFMIKQRLARPYVKGERETRSFSDVEKRLIMGRFCQLATLYDMDFKAHAIE